VATPFAGSATALADAALVAACLDGSHVAWDEMVRRFGRLVYSIPRHYGFSEADADDVHQAVFTQLYQKLGTVRDADRLAPWLIRTTHRVCYRVGKRSRRYAELHGVIEDVAEPAAEDAEVWEQRHLVRVALDRLGGRCQALLTALFLAPGAPNYESIAASLGMKIGSIGPTRARCFAKLEKILGELAPHWTEGYHATSGEPLQDDEGSEP
jgi:RNA polymerase sigma factor (sigma-70 family)